MTDEIQEIDKIDRAVKMKWEELHSVYAEDDRSSPHYLVQWNHIQAYREVWTNVAFEVPFEGRVADAAVDAKTSVKVLELVLERQARAEAKIDRIVGFQRTISSATSAIWILVLASAVFQYLSG
ncbi:MAG: hypothetical protein ACT4OK_15695 [Gemmobacter sp.]